MNNILKTMNNDKIGKYNLSIDKIIFLIKQ